MTKQTDMHEIDFLPAEYRQQHALRRRQPWRIIFMAGIGVLVAVAALVQNYVRRSIVADLAAIEAQHELVTRQSRQLADLQSQLLSARATAELITYLRYPWPRTRILAEVLGPLPEDLVIERLEIAHKRRSDQGPTRQRSRTEEKAEEAKLASLPAATRDLTELRKESEPLQTVVTLTGATTDSAALHRYLGVLEKSNLFSKAELSDFESSTTDRSGSLQFTIVLIVRPGYGQPGGPAGPDNGLAAQTRGTHEEPSRP